MDVCLGFHNDHRCYAIPAKIISLYPASPIFAFASEPSYEKQDTYIIDGIGYEDFELGYQYIMSHRRVEVTEAVEKVLNHYGFWDDAIETYVQECKTKIELLKKITAGTDRLIVVDNEKIHEEFSSFTAKTQYQYIVPLAIHMVDGVFSSVSIKLSHQGRDVNLPIYPLEKFKAFGIHEVVTVELPIPKDQIPEGKYDTFRSAWALTQMMLGWMVLRIGGPPDPDIIVKLIEFLASAPWMITLAINKVDKTLGRDVYYGFYIAPSRLPVACN